MSNEYDLNNNLEFEKLDDAWLSESLNQLKMNPSDTFTDNVIEKLDIKPKQSWDSPIFWILIAIPALFVISGLLFSLKPLMNYYDVNVNFFFSNYSFLVISKYVFFILITGLMLVGVDYFINKNLTERKVYMHFWAI